MTCDTPLGLVWQRCPVSLRTIQEWMGHRGFATTLIYAGYQPGTREAELVEAAFASNKPSNNLNDTQEPSRTQNVLESE